MELHDVFSLILTDAAFALDFFHGCLLHLILFKLPSAAPLPALAAERHEGPDLRHCPLRCRRGRAPVDHGQLEPVERRQPTCQRRRRRRPPGRESEHKENNPFFRRQRQFGTHLTLSPSPTPQSSQSILCGATAVPVVALESPGQRESRHQLY